MGNDRALELSAKLQQVYLRRSKEDTLSDFLPKKDERIVFCELSDLQKELYKYILEQPDFVVLRQKNAPCDCGVNRKVCIGIFFLKGVLFRLPSHVLMLFSFSLNTSGCVPKRSKLNTNARIGITLLNAVAAATDILELTEELIPKQFCGSSNILRVKCANNVLLALRFPQ